MSVHEGRCRCSCAAPRPRTGGLGRPIHPSDGPAPPPQGERRGRARPHRCGRRATLPSSCGRRAWTPNSSPGASSTSGRHRPRLDPARGQGPRVPGRRRRRPGERRLSGAGGLRGARPLRRARPPRAAPVVCRPDASHARPDVAGPRGLPSPGRPGYRSSPTGTWRGPMSTVRITTTIADDRSPRRRRPRRLPPQEARQGRQARLHRTSSRWPRASSTPSSTAGPRAGRGIADPSRRSADMDAIASWIDRAGGSGHAGRAPPAPPPQVRRPQAPAVIPPPGPRTRARRGDERFTPTRLVQRLQEARYVATSRAPTRSVIPR
jgi:hypothetical protein